ELAAAQLILGDRGAGLLVPADLAVIDPDVVSALRVILEHDKRGALIGSFGEDLEAAAAAEAFIAEAGSRGDKALESCQLLRATESRDVFVENLCAGGLTGGLFDEVVLFIIRRAIEAIERDRGGGGFAAMMAGPAGYVLNAAEVGLIDSGNHVDHLARGDLLRRIDDPVRFIGTGAGMAIGAIEAEVG